MHRRAAAPRGLLLLAALAVVVTALLVTTPPMAAAQALEPVHVTAAAAAPDRPPVTANDFIPEERNLSDCIGALERPGCGSESRGGWRQTLVFLVVGAGLVVVFGRVAWAARRSRQRA